MHLQSVVAVIIRRGSSPCSSNHDAYTRQRYSVFVHHLARESICLTLLYHGRFTSKGMVLLRYGDKLFVNRVTQILAAENLSQGLADVTRVDLTSKCLVLYFIGDKQDLVVGLFLQTFEHISKRFFLRFNVYLLVFYV